MPKKNNTENNGGWIKLFRKFTEWGWFTVPNTAHLFIYCLLQANTEKKEWRGVSVKRGSFITSLDILASQTGLSVMEVRTALKHLQDTKEIVTEVTNKYRVITICNYDTYQGEKREANKQITSKEQAGNNQITTTKEDICTKEYIYEKIRIKEKEYTYVYSKEKIFLFAESLVSNGVEQGIANTWMLIRKRKKAVNSEQAFANVINTFDKVTKRLHISENDIIKIAVANSWYGCKASYFDNVVLSDYGIEPTEKQKTIWE